MRILHPTTLKIASERNDIPKTVISHVWSEIFKWKSSGQKHPKMFIEDEEFLGCYLAFVYRVSIIKGCNFDNYKISHLGEEINRVFKKCSEELGYKRLLQCIYPTKEFDNNYLFSDACSLYYKGINIFPDIFGDQWRKYVPVESLKEIKRQVDRTLLRK
jgi:hypothetical protein